MARNSTVRRWSPLLLEAPCKLQFHFYRYFRDLRQHVENGRADENHSIGGRVERWRIQHRNA
jgi:hypothetical protein